MRVGDLRWEIEHIHLVSLDKIHSVSDSMLMLLCRTVEGSLATPLCCDRRVRGRVEQHLPSDFRPEIPNARLFFCTMRRPGHLVRAVSTAVRAT